MRRVRIIRPALVALAVLGFCLPQPMLAAVDGPAPTTGDVALADGGVLLGQVVDRQGASLARVTVSLRGTDGRMAVTETDSGGYFSIGGLRGGAYEVLAAGGRGKFRLWTPGNAPPKSRKGVLVVGGRRTVRGQYPQFGALGFWLSNPWVLAGVAAAAVAVPIAIHNAQRPSSP